MIKYADIRTAMVSGLWEHMDIPIILANHNAPKPDYPFGRYTFTTPQQGFYPRSGFYSVEEEGEMLDYKRQDEGRMVLSLTFCSDDSTEAHEKALEAAAWFAWKGYFYLKEKGIIVVRVEAMTNRDTLIVDDYERRIGFDVQLRVDSSSTKEIESIEQAEVSKKESD